MLVLTRNPLQTLVINGDIVITILSIAGGAVRIGIEAPKDVPIRRGELEQRIRNGQAPDLRIFKPAA